ncbi:MAG: hypothetical protein HQM08_06075 [Candidatus Riflebacteria bacterium]|nr:hypothetical protein [Candidatus Riflebacteria bacterium]
MINMLLSIPTRDRLDTISVFYPELTNMELSEKKDFLSKLIASQYLDPFREQLSRELVELADIKALIPDVYSDFRTIVVDGISFLLKRISEGRLKKLLVKQILLPKDTEPGERLLAIAAALPTLHKLGQIIARNKNIDTSFKKWLIKLESMIPEKFEIIDSVIAEIRKEQNGIYEILVDDQPLAEASVGVVTGFKYRKLNSPDFSSGVFKIVKPDVELNLNEEIKIIDDLSDYFDKNREKYPLKNFKYRDVFDEIKDSLKAEINLLQEQKNLRAAKNIFQNQSKIGVPGVLHFSTEKVTAMERVNGEKISRATLDTFEASRFAEELYWNLFGKVLFSSEKSVIFHGDPHAGNIFVEKSENGKRIRILDWSQTGSLTKLQRINILQIALGIVTSNHNRISGAVLTLSKEPLKRLPFIEEKILDTLNKFPANSFLMEKTMSVIDSLSLEGCAFPGELLWFRKSFFTLMGVITELDESLDLDEIIFKHLRNYVLFELPERISGSILLRSDKPERYQSMVTNLDLVSLLQCGIVDGLGKTINREFQRIGNISKSCIKLYSLPFSVSNFSTSTST